MGCMCTRAGKVMSLLGATLAFVAAISFMIGIAARDSPSDNYPHAAYSHNFTLKAASSNHCGWALYVKSHVQEAATSSRVGRLTGFFGTGRRLTVPCTRASIGIHSPSGTLVYLANSTINSVGFVDTCGAEQSQWMQRHEPQLDHVGHFSLYDNPSLQAKETGEYRIVSNLELVAYDYCEEFVEADHGMAGAFSMKQHDGRRNDAVPLSETLSAMASFLVDSTDSGGLVSRPRKQITVQLALAAVFNDVPGDFVELGVFNGGTAILMAKVLNVYDRSSPPRVLWAADSFQGLPDDTQFNTSGRTGAFGKEKAKLRGKKGQFRSARSVFERNIKKNGLWNASRINILEGFFSETLPSAPITTISFLRLDGDIFISTWQGLDLLYGKLSKGGLIYVDDYGSYSGCKAAVDKFRQERGISEPILPVYESPGVYEAIWWQKATH